MDEVVDFQGGQERGRRSRGIISKSFSHNAKAREVATAWKQSFQGFKENAVKKQGGWCRKGGHSMLVVGSSCEEIRSWDAAGKWADFGVSIERIV